MNQSILDRLTGSQFGASLYTEQGLFAVFKVTPVRTTAN